MTLGNEGRLSISSKVEPVSKLKKPRWKKGLISAIHLITIFPTRILDLRKFFTGFNTRFRNSIFLFTYDEKEGVKVLPCNRTKSGTGPSLYLTKGGSGIFTVIPMILLLRTKTCLI